jgi:hypothetical protein
MKREYTREYSKKCVGAGWHGLIDELFDLAEKENFTVVQVKEKYSTLRIYLHGATEEIYKKIDKLEHRSSTICEVCGGKGRKIVRGGWLKTRCEEHE